MKLKMTLSSCSLVMLLVFWHPGMSWSGMDAGSRQIEAVTTFSYRAGSGDSPETARALALYGAKYKAVLLSAKQLADNGVLKDYGERQMEILCLVADELPADIVDAAFVKEGSTYRVTIKSSASLADFVRAEIRNAAFEEIERHFSLQEEMEPVVLPTIAPAQELSRAYRYISNHHWRMAIIYLDHLERKYPHWGTLLLAKAMAYLGMHETERTVSALSSACYLGDQDACLKINELDPPD